MVRVGLVVVLLFSSVSCSTMPRGGGGARSGEVTHVIVVWLKKPGDEAARKRVIEESKKLVEIPGVRSVSAGSVIPSPRQVVDSS